MLHSVIQQGNTSLLAFGGILFAFIATVFATAKLCNYLPKDGGREYAHDGKLSAGKMRGAGLLFVIAFVLSNLLFSELKAEYLLYGLCVFLSMLSGYLDDRSEKPWNEYKKGIIDLVICGSTSAVFALYNPTLLNLSVAGFSVLL